MNKDVASLIVYFANGKKKRFKCIAKNIKPPIVLRKTIFLDLFLLKTMGKRNVDVIPLIMRVYCEDKKKLCAPDTAVCIIRGLKNNVWRSFIVIDGNFLFSSITNFAFVLGVDTYFPDMREEIISEIVKILSSTNIQLIFSHLIDPYYSLQKPYDYT